MRRSVRASVLAALLGVAAMTARAAAPDAPPPPIAVRMVKLGGEVSDPKVRAHVAFCRDLGFNALWAYSWAAGAWGPTRAPRGPIVDRGFVEAARGFVHDGLDIWVSINPPADDTGFVFSGTEGEDRIVAFVKRLRRTIGLKHLVISFDDQPTELTELADVLRYGRSAAPAHLDLVRRLAARLPADLDLWLCAAAYCDAHLADGSGPYSKPFLEGLSALPSRVGIVWTGPLVISPKITGADIEATRARLGGRRLFLYDNAFANEGDGDDGMALLLAPLRGRDPGLGRVISAYLACPMEALGGSRLALLTTADWLNDPAGYDPDVALQHAMVRLAGAAAAEPRSWEAFRTQQLEWGGFAGERNFWPRDAANPTLTASRLIDPAFVSSFTWTVARYPDRIAALERIHDAPFRDDLTAAMRRRLAVARAVPLVLEYRARVAAGRADAAVVLEQIRAERVFWKDVPDALRVLDLFLTACGITSS